MSKPNPKSVSFRLRVWADPTSRMIKIASPDVGLISTVSNEPVSKRYHPNLFMKLRRVLKAAGKWPERM